MFFWKKVKKYLFKINIQTIFITFFEVIFLENEMYYRNAVIQT